MFKLGRNRLLFGRALPGISINLSELVLKSGIDLDVSSLLIEGDDIAARLVMESPYRLLRVVIDHRMAVEAVEHLLVYVDVRYLGLRHHRVLFLERHEGWIMQSVVERLVDHLHLVLVLRLVAYPTDWSSRPILEKTSKSFSSSNP